MNADVHRLTEHIKDPLRRARVQRRLHAEMRREARDAGEMSWDELLHAENRLEFEDAPDEWPWAAIKRLEGWTLRGLEELAREDAARLERYDRHARHCIAHERTCATHRDRMGAWEFFSGEEWLGEAHVWTLRILRSARRAAARA